mgnify:CR=1 FL=1
MSQDTNTSLDDPESPHKEQYFGEEVGEFDMGQDRREFSSEEVNYSRVSSV